MVCPGRGRASAPRLRVVPRVQVAHFPAGPLYADTRRPSGGWRGPSAAESVHASLHPPLRPLEITLPIGSPIAGRRPPTTLGAWGRPIAALAVSVPLTVRGTPSPRCVCAGRDCPRAGTHRTENQCGVISPGASHATTRGLRDGSGVHTPSSHLQPPCPWLDLLPPGAVQLCGAAWGGTPFGCRLGRSTIWVPPGAEHHSGAAWGGAPRHCSPLLASLPAIALVSIVSVAAVPVGAVRRVAADR